MKQHMQRGFSIVELMVAVTLSMILMAGVLSIFASSKVTYLSNEKVARLQENGRMALDLIVRDIRASGYMGCAKAVPFNTTLNTPTALRWDYSRPMQGFESTGPGSWSPALTTAVIPAAQAAQDGSDAILLRVSQREGTSQRVTNNLASATADPQVAAAVANGIMMITDCNASTVFQVTGFAAAGGSACGRWSHGRRPRQLDQQPLIRLSEGCTTDPDADGGLLRAQQLTVAWRG